MDQWTDGQTLFEMRGRNGQKSFGHRQLGSSGADMKAVWQMWERYKNNEMQMDTKAEAEDNENYWKRN